MNGSALRELRKNRAWSQRHLATAAGVSVRTVQRAESSGRCSDESLLALAAALDVDITLLLADDAGAHGATRSIRSLLPIEISPHVAALSGALASLPAVLFISSNILKFEYGKDWLYNALDAAGSWLPLSSILVHPIILIGGPLFAVAINLVAQTKLWGDMDADRQSISLFGIELTPSVSSVAVVLIALLCIGLLGAYVVTENLAHYIQDLAN